MGRLTSGHYNVYGKGREQINVARENYLRNPNGSHSKFGSFLVNTVPSLFMLGGEMFAASLDKSDNTNNVPEKDERQKDIETKEKEIFSIIKTLSKSTTVSTDDFNNLKGKINDYYNTYKIGEGSIIDTLTVVQGIRNGTITEANFSQSLKKPSNGI